MVSDSILQLAFKKSPLIKLWYNIREELLKYHHFFQLHI